MGVRRGGHSEGARIEKGKTGEDVEVYILRGERERVCVCVYLWEIAGSS